MLVSMKGSIHSGSQYSYIKKKTCDVNPTNAELSDGSAVSLFKKYITCVSVYECVCVSFHIYKKLCTLFSYYVEI